MKNKKQSAIDTILSLLVSMAMVFLFTGLLIAQDRSNLPSHFLGKTVFNEKECNRCHSIFGEGGKGGPDFGKDKYYGTNLELAATMWNHYPMMSKKLKKNNIEFPELSTDELQNLIDYLLYVRYFSEHGNEFRGRKLLKTMNCVKCHKFGGEGGTIGPDMSLHKEYISPMKLAEAMWNHGPNMKELFKENEIEHSEFWKDDIIHVSAAIKSFMSASKFPSSINELGDCDTGLRLINEKGCLHCHSLNGKGNTIGPEFNSIDFNYSVLTIAGKMWNHGPKMWELMEQKNISIPVFNPGELCNIIFYLYNLNLNDQPGDATLGHELILKRNCLNCHSLNGAGNNVSVDLGTIKNVKSPVEMIAAMWSHAPAMDKKRIEKKMSWPKLDARDMANLYAYLSSLSNNEGIIKGDPE